MMALAISGTWGSSLGSCIGWQGTKESQATGSAQVPQPSEEDKVDGQYRTRPKRTAYRGQLTILAPPQLPVSL